MKLKDFIKENINLSREQVMLKYNLTNEAWKNAKKLDVLKSLHYFKFEMQQEEEIETFLEKTINKIYNLVDNYVRKYKNKFSKRK